MGQNKKISVQQFASEIAQSEAGLSQAKIGDIRQILRIANKKLAGRLYSAIEDRFDANNEVEDEHGRPDEPGNPNLSADPGY